MIHVAIYVYCELHSLAWYGMAILACHILYISLLGWALVSHTYLHLTTLECTVKRWLWLLRPVCCCCFPLPQNEMNKMNATCADLKRQLQEALASPSSGSKSARFHHKQAPIGSAKGIVGTHTHASSSLVLVAILSCTLSSSQCQGVTSVKSNPNPISNFNI